MSNPSIAIRSLDPAPEPPCRLAELEPGARAAIVEILGTDPARERLLDLGFVPGTVIEFVRRAPLGDPSVYALRGVKTCLRRVEAERILVRPLCDPDA